MAASTAATTSSATPSQMRTQSILTARVYSHRVRGFVGTSNKHEGRSLDKDPDPYGPPDLCALLRDPVVAGHAKGLFYAGYDPFGPYARRT